MIFLESYAFVSSVRWTSLTHIAFLDFTIPAAAVSIFVVTIIATKNKFEAISASFQTEPMMIKEFRPTKSACVWINTAETSIRASNTFAMIVIKIAAYCARWWIVISLICVRIWCTYSIDFCVSVQTLTEIFMPFWVRLLWTTITNSTCFNSIANTL